MDDVLDITTGAGEDGGGGAASEPSLDQLAARDAGGADEAAFDAAFEEATAGPGGDEPGAEQGEDGAAKPAKAAGKGKKGKAAPAPATPQAAQTPAWAEPESKPGAAQPSGAEISPELAEAERLAAARTGGEEAPPAASSEAPAQATAPPAQTQPPSAAQPGALRLAETVPFGGQTYNVNQLIEDYGVEVGALSTAIAQATLQGAIERGELMPAQAVREQLTAMQQQVAWQSHLAEVSELSGVSARKVLADPEFQGWLGQQSAGIKLLAERGSAAEAAQVVKAYVESRQTAKVKTFDEQRAKDKARTDALHKNTLRDQATGRFAGREDAGENDFDAEFDRITR